jgi:outer membrane protein assembly factor BamB
MGENIIVGTEKGVVYALSAADGSIVWSHTTGGKIYSNIVISNETILVSPMSAEFHLAGLNADGKDAWQPFTPK